MNIIGLIAYKFINFLLMYRARYQKSCFAKCGTGVSVGHGCDFICNHIHVGDNVHIGPYASFMASISHIHIDDFVLIGPHCTIRGGDHRIGVIGKHLYNVKDKLPENDKDVHIKKGCWIGCNATILKGVTVSRGTVVAAGAVITRSTPPYSVVGGVPAKFIKFYWTIDEILEHEAQLYSPNERFSRKYLEDIYSQYNK